MTTFWQLISKLGSKITNEWTVYFAEHLKLLNQSFSH